VWKGLLAGKKRGCTHHSVRCQQFCLQIAAEVKNFDPLKFIERKELKKMGRSSIWLSPPLTKPCRWSGLKVTPENDERVGVHIGSGIGGFDIIEREHTALMDRRPAQDLSFLHSCGNRQPGGWARLHALRRPKGLMKPRPLPATNERSFIGDPSASFSTTMLMSMIAGGSEGGHYGPWAGWFAAMRVFTRNDDPEKASAPGTRSRRLVIGEGAGILSSKSWIRPEARRSHPG